MPRRSTVRSSWSSSAWRSSRWPAPGSASACCLGIVLALYGLSVFNLHYWGFGVPFLLIGSWYLVRTYRISQRLKLAKSGETSAGGSGPARRAQPNKRYTPPTTGPAKAPKPIKPTATDDDG